MSASGRRALPLDLDVTVVDTQPELIEFLADVNPKFFPAAPIAPLE
jgi:hypothetical protein